MKEEFIKYVLSFYHPSYDAIYPFDGLTVDDVREAVDFHINHGRCEFAADSFDREQVAQILCNDFGYSYPPASITL